MNGCRWQEKSFSVAVSSKRCFDICSICQKEADEVYKYNGDILCKDCFSKKPNRSNRIFGMFNTHKDLAYTFTTDMFGGSPLEVRSKRQYKGLLKQHNLADASIKECRQQADFRKRINEEGYSFQRRKTAEKIFSEKRELLRFRRQNVRR